MLDQLLSKVAPRVSGNTIKRVRVNVHASHTSNEECPSTVNVMTYG